MTYYTLAPTAPAIGTMLGTDPNETYVTADPRTLPVTDLTENWDPCIQTATAIVQSADLTLIRVEPVGDAQGPDDYDRTYFAGGGWKVIGIEASVDAVLGPQSARVREIVAEAEKSLTGFGDTNPLGNAYCEAVNERYDANGVHVTAAEDALQRIGADGYQWTGCEYGDELLALAARDLIDSTALWTQAAYDALTEPWRIAMGTQVHPDDPAPVPVA